MPQRTTSVIIVGGGPVGLSCSILLSLRGIPNQLFERHAQTSIHPKACGINQRTVEIFRIMGIENEVYEHAAPSHIAGRTAWYTGFGTDSKEIISRDAWGGGTYAEEYASFSPCRNVMDGVLGIEITKSSEANKQAAAGFFDPRHPDYQAKREAVQYAQKVLDSEFKAPGFEVGWFYLSADINREDGETHGGQQLPDRTLISEF